MNIRIAQNQSVSGSSWESSVVDISEILLFSMQVTWSGELTGYFRVMVSNDATNYHELIGSRQNVGASSSGSFIYQTNMISVSRMKVQWIGSGSATVTIQVTGRKSLV